MKWHIQNEQRGENGGKDEDYELIKNINQRDGQKEWDRIKRNDCCKE